jgi:hypothetical protein
VIAADDDFVAVGQLTEPVVEVVDHAPATGKRCEVAA